MPRNGVTVFPMRFKCVPNSTEVLRILEDDNRKVRFLYLRTFLLLIKFLKNFQLVLGHQCHLDWELNGMKNGWEDI